jgi:hypothetical protein
MENECSANKRVLRWSNLNRLRGNRQPLGQAKMAPNWFRKFKRTMPLRYISIHQSGAGERSRTYIQYSVTHHMHQMINRISDNTHVQRHVRSRRVVLFGRSSIISHAWWWYTDGTTTTYKKYWLYAEANIGCVAPNIDVYWLSDSWQSVNN